MSPFLEDFTTELTPTPDGEMRGLNHAAAMAVKKGIGCVDWTIRDVFGHVSLVHWAHESLRWTTDQWLINESFVCLFSLTLLLWTIVANP